MSTAYNHPQAVASNANAELDTSATTVKPVDGAPQGGFSIKGEFVYSTNKHAHVTHLHIVR